MTINILIRILLTLIIFSKLNSITHILIYDKLSMQCSYIFIFCICVRKVIGIRISFYFAFSPFQGFIHWLLFDLSYFIVLPKWILICIFYFYKIQFSCVKFCRSKICQDFTFPIHIRQQQSSCCAVLAFVNFILYWFFSSAMFVMNWMITDSLHLIFRSSIR